MLSVSAVCSGLVREKLNCLLIISVDLNVVCLLLNKLPHTVSI